MEPCPYCDGTGRRAVPPPIEAGGHMRGKKLGAGPRHGYESTYQGGCRCTFCRAAHREYSKIYRARVRARAAS